MVSDRGKRPRSGDDGHLRADEIRQVFIGDLLDQLDELLARVLRVTARTLDQFGKCGKAAFLPFLLADRIDLAQRALGLVVPQDSLLGISC